MRVVMGLPGKRQSWDKDCADYARSQAADQPEVEEEGWPENVRYDLLVQRTARRVVRDLWWRGRRGPWRGCTLSRSEVLALLSEACLAAAPASEDGALAVLRQSRSRDAFTGLDRWWLEIVGDRVDGGEDSDGARVRWEVLALIALGTDVMHELVQNDDLVYSLLSAEDVDPDDALGPKGRRAGCDASAESHAEDDD